MADETERTVDEAMIRQLARLAGLNLSDERRPAIADQLDGLLSAANEVNRFMADRREVGPGVRFDHPEARRDDDS